MKKTIAILLTFQILFLSCDDGPIVEFPDESGNDQTITNCGGDLLTGKWWISQHQNIADAFFDDNGTVLTRTFGVSYNNNWQCTGSNIINMQSIDFPGYNAVFTITSITETRLEANIEQTGFSGAVVFLSEWINI